MVCYGSAIVGGGIRGSIDSNLVRAPKNRQANHAAFIRVSASYDSSNRTRDYSPALETGNCCFKQSSESSEGKNNSVVLAETIQSVPSVTK